MDHNMYGTGVGGNWTMIPTNMQQQIHSNSPLPTTSSTSQDHLYHLSSPQQQQNPLQFNSPAPTQQFNSPSQQQPPFQFNSPPPQQQPIQFNSPPQQQYNIQQQQRMVVVQQQNPNHQSLASHFHLLHLVENCADAIENGTRDQHSDALVNELNTHFEKCQTLLNSISSSISSKAMRAFCNGVSLLPFNVSQRKDVVMQFFFMQTVEGQRDLISNYRSSVEELMNADP